MKWNSKETVWYPDGKKCIKFGDTIHKGVLNDPKKAETIKEYIKDGLILDGKAVVDEKKSADEKERLSLIDHAKTLGLKPHVKTGIAKLNIMIDDAKALIDLKDEALTLGIDPSDDVTFADLTILVDEKKSADESDS